eukprot:5337586-Karenia_brevis.AAC.1
MQQSQRANRVASGSAQFQCGHFNVREQWPVGVCTDAACAGVHVRRDQLQCSDLKVREGRPVAAR